jgi:ABC-type lipoprotein export system ATPase subunit
LRETDIANPDYIVECDNLVKIYKTRDIEVLALQGLELSVKRGELMAIIGNSGSGKSTFLNMLGGLDRPNAGRLYVDGKNLFKMTEKELVEYKRSTVGFVWQNNARNLLPWLPAWQNVQTPMLFGSMKERKKRALELLDLVGLSHKANSRLSQMSGGEQQRVAIAIALANDPKLLLADEPTGSVDSRTSAYILDVFRRLNRETGLTIIIVTHDRALSKRVNRVVAIRDGKTASEMVMTESFRQQLEASGALDGEDFQADVPDAQEEFSVLDRAGRVQISQALLEQAGINGRRVRMFQENGRIIIEKE